MKKMQVLAMLIALVVTSALTVPALSDDEGGCVCKRNREAGNGWCSSCDVGWVHRVSVKSKKLFQALEGQEVADVEKLECDGCRKAVKENGACESCKASFNEGRRYRSPVALTLSKGRMVCDSELGCDGCRSAQTSSGSKYCAPCHIGFVGGMLFEGEKMFKKARAAMMTLKKASSTARKCESCAVAMVTDHKCKRCRLEFKNGRKIRKVEKI